MGTGRKTETMDQVKIETERTVFGVNVDSFEERFWSKVDKNGANSCWNWTTGKDRYGYGQITINKRNLRSHRVSYAIRHGDIENGLHCLHECDNPACVNPDHLFLGTNQDNMDDKVSKGRQVSLKGESNGTAKLTAVKVLEIKRLLAGGVTQRAIASVYGVSQKNVSLIKAGKRWAHVKPVHELPIV